MSKTAKIVFLVIVAVAAIVFAYYLRSIFMPLVVALLLSYIVNPLVTGLEKRRIPRLASIAGVYVLLGGILFAIGFWGVPAAVKQGKEFVHETFIGPDAKLEKVKLWAGTRVKDWLGASNWEEVKKKIAQRVEGRFGDIAQATGKIIGEVLAFMTSSVSAFVSVVSFIALVPVYLFFLLKNMNVWWERVKEGIPAKYRERTLHTLTRIHRANAAFFRGQLTISFLEGILVFAGLAIIGVKFSFLFGALYAVLSLVPFLGVVIGFTITELFVLADTGGFTTTFFLVAGLFAFIQALEASFLQPFILGKETGLHPIAVILTLLICGDLFGFFGMLIAVPIATTVKILLEDYVWPIFQDVTKETALIKRPTPT